MIEKNKQNLILLKFFLITNSIIHILVYKCFVLKINDTNIKLNDISKMIKKYKDFNLS